MWAYFSLTNLTNKEINYVNLSAISETMSDTTTRNAHNKIN